jgi:hypothetical protein
VDEREDCFGWIQVEALQRTSHALRVDGGVWLIDPVDEPDVEGRIRALGEPAGVLQLLDRHSRGGAAWAARLGVPFRRAWEDVDGTPFQALGVCDNRLWHEVALWEPNSRTLLCGDALGTLAYFRAGDEQIGVHPLLRLRPPRSLGTVGPARVLVGHGDGVFADASAALHAALATARRRIPQAVVSAVRAVATARAASR